MTNRPFRAAGDSMAERQPRSFEHLWSIRKNGVQLDCVLRDHGSSGVEARIIRDGEFLLGRRWPSRDLAIEEAEDLRQQYIREGGTLVLQPPRP
jgi:hypothetical protein